MKKLLLTISLCICLTGAFCLTGCGGADEGTTSEDVNTEAAAEEANEVDYAAMKDAYRSVLEENESGIRACEDADALGSCAVESAVSLCDINGDGARELFFFSKDEDAPKLNIYTYTDEGAKKLEYEYSSQSFDYMDAFSLPMAGGAFDYAVFTTEKGELVCDSCSNGETTIYTLNDYSFDGFSLDQEWAIEYAHIPAIANDSSEVNEYRVGGAESSQSEYENLRDQAFNSLDQVVFCQKDSSDETSEEDPYGHPEDPVWELFDESESLQMTYDEAISQLL